jgi:hypothetical protein
MIYMFNELSLTQVNSISDARLVLETFIKSSIKAKEIGFTELRLYENSIHNLYEIYLFDNYRIDNWLKDGEVNPDLKTRFREIITNSPLITNEEISLKELYQWSVFQKAHNNQIAQVWGLGAAYIYDSLALSLNSHDDWQSPIVPVSHNYLTPKGEEINKEIEVRHFASTKTLDSHLEWWERVQLESLNKSIELWERRGEFFPNLIFCQEVEKQLQKIGVSKMLFQIIDRLKSLDSYSENWGTGSFSYEDVNSKTNLRISPESDSTIRLHGSSRKFIVPGEGKKLFDLHIKTGDLRFHFYPDNDNHQIYIGYIGRHLRIASEG